MPMLIHQINAGETVTIHGAPGNIGSRFYLHVRNCADALLFLLNRRPAQFKDGSVSRPDCYNIVGDIELDNLELAQRIATLVGKPLKYRLEDFHLQRPGHDRRYSLSGEKMKELGWRPPLTFDESLKQTVEWTLANPEWL